MFAGAASGGWIIERALHVPGPVGFIVDTLAPVSDGLKDSLASADLYGMDARTHVRVPVSPGDATPVAITVLTGPELRLEGRVKDTSPHGLGIVSPQKVTPGSAVKVETNDNLFLGEVVHCSATDDGWFLGIRVTQVLSGLAALSSMVREFDAFLHPAARSPADR